VLRLAINRRMLLLLPELAFTGISISYYSGILVEMMSLTLYETSGNTMSDADQFFYSMLAMTVFGVGEVFGCFFIGVIIDKHGSKKATVVILCIITLMSLMTFSYIIVWEFGVLAYLMCFLWGF
jgi:MFS family permease